MKLILVHGNLAEAVLRKTDAIKSGFDPLAVTEVENGEVDFSSSSLFSDKRLFILDNPDIKVFEKVAKEDSPDMTVLMRFTKQLEKSSPILKKAADIKAEIISFEDRNQNSIFPFLDLLGNLNPKAFTEFEKNYQEFGGQYLITMIAYFLRRMVLLKTASDFMKTKITQQKKNFPEERIKILYRELILTDYNVKKGLTDDRLGLSLLVEKILRSGR